MFLRVSKLRFSILAASFHHAVVVVWSTFLALNIPVNQRIFMPILSVTTGLMIFGALYAIFTKDKL